MYLRLSVFYGIRFVIVFILFLAQSGNAQIKSNINIETDIFGYQGKVMPLWMYANQWGIRSKDLSPGILMHVSGDYSFIHNKNFELKAGVGAVTQNQSGQSFLHEAYIDGRVWFVDYTIGKQAYSPLVYNDDLTSGFFMGNTNARPLPRITVGIFNYLPLKFVNNWLEVRGGISQGWLNDDRGEKGPSDVLYHEKFAYIRMGHFKVKPYAGIVHSALFGGTMPNGEKIPIDYWATFFGKGSSEVGGGEESNAAGAHMGLFDFGVDFELKGFKTHVYLQKPFKDGSGMRIDSDFLNDHIIGVLLELDKKQLVSGLSFEYIKTSWQSGPGTPDPIDPETDELVFISDIEDVDAYMLERFNEETDGWTHDDLDLYLQQEWNHGYKFGGRDDYMNNYMYYAGFSYNGAIMGTPLFHTAELTSKYAPDWDSQNNGFVINNRVEGFHFGLSGWLGETKYLLKVSTTKNFGCYAEEYLGNYSWEESPSYFFKLAKTQTYTGMVLEYPLWRKHKIDMKLSINYDFGDFYQSMGGLIGLKWNPVF